MTTTPNAVPPAAPASLPPALTVNGLRAAYGRIEVLHGVDLTVPAGARLRPPRAQRRRQVDPAEGGERPACAPATARW